jgi:hypothetical protein
MSACDELVEDRQHQPRCWTLALAGGWTGGLLGIVSGPIAMLAFMRLKDYLHGTTFLGLELLGAPIIGSILGALEGAGLGAVWKFIVERPRRLTIARLMLVVAISGPDLALVVADPPFATLILSNAVLPLPELSLVLVRRCQEESA